MKPAHPEGDIPRLAWRLPGLARRTHRLAATVTAGPPLQLTVRSQERRYQAQIDGPGTGRTWRCPHQHLTQASASRCAGVMARRIHRVGWRRATRLQRKTGRSRGQPG